MIVLSGKQQCDIKGKKERKKRQQKLGILVPFNIGALYILAASLVSCCIVTHINKANL